MGIIDTHTHLESFSRKGVLRETLARAKEAGLEGLITIGTSPEDWSLYRSIVVEHPGLVYYSVGLHPCSVDASWENAVGQMEAYWSGTAPRPVALGECGLDRFHLPKEPAEAERVFAWQRAAFSAQLQQAKQRRCPVVVHSRGAFRECVEMIDASGVDWKHVVFHCFTEGAVEMGELLERGGFGSFTGIITYKTADALRVAAREQGLARCMIETDAPYLTPVPHRGKPNEPAYLVHTAEYVAREVFAVSRDELVSATSDMARRFFGL